ncbi:MAG: YkvA family protein [Desulfobacterales bacterium]
MNDPEPSITAAGNDHRIQSIRSAGVAGIGDPKWIAVALCYIAAIALMGQDPWYGDKYFTYNQGIFVGILAVLMVAGFGWEIYLLGRPGGINLVLHCLLILPIALLIGRIAGLPPEPETSYGLLGKLKDYIGSLKDASGIEGILPFWIQDIFYNPAILLLIFFTSLAFTQKKASRRFALVVVAFLIPAMQTLTHDPRPSIAFGLGFGAMLAGIALQFSKYGDISGQQNVLNRLNAVDDRLELKCSLRIAKRAVEDGFITEDGVLAVIQREYSKQFDPDPLVVRGIAQAISHRLVREHRILELRGDERGFFLIPYEALFKIESLFDEISVWIRKIIITGIAIIWVISPIDLFPDSIPVLGAIDDALIALVGAGQWLGTGKRRKLPKP